MRVLREQAWQVEVRFEDEGGNLVDPDDVNAVSVDVLDGTSTSIQSGTATQDSLGVFTFTLDPQSVLDTLTVQWSATFDGVTRLVETEAEVCGSRLVSLARLREDEELTGLPDRILQRVAEATEDWFDEALGWPPFSKPARIGMAYPGGRRLVLPGIHKPLKVINVSRNGTDLSASVQSRIRSRAGWLEVAQSNTDPRPSEFDAGWYDWHVEHGVQFTTGDVRRAGAILARYIGRQVSYPERASQVVTDGAVVTFSIPSPNRPTGIPEVDAVIVRHAVDNPVGFPVF